jgi:glycosyltransferase involved in cell wall biosynthesis
VNLDPVTIQDIPWKVYAPTLRESDPYGLHEIPRIVQGEEFDMMWTTFDPEVPWKYPVPGTEPPTSALAVFHSLRQANPGFRMMGWFPVDGGPLSHFEMSVLGADAYFDVPVTMASHVHDLMEWTIQLAGGKSNREALEQRLKVIPHGVDLEKYAIPTDEERRDAKQRLGVDPDTFVILQLERNQQRKINWMAQEVMERILKQRPSLRGKLLLNQHMMEDEESQGAGLGYNLPLMAERYGLQRGRDIIWPAGGGVPEEEMSRTIYASADVFLSTSTGEGFQYPLWEALACGVPCVVPNDSARAAWHKDTPNVHLYETAKRSHVMRGGYARRMGFPNAANAAKTIMNIIDGKRPKFKRHSDKGRAFVERVSSLESVQQQWVGIVAEQEKELMKERSGMKMAVPGDEHEFLVTMVNNPGHGDLVMAGPALEALRKHGSVKLRVQRQRLHLARLLGLADAYETHKTPNTSVNTTIRLEGLYFPKHRSTWGDPSVNRSLTISRWMGLEDDELLPFGVTLDEEKVQMIRAQFLEQFGVDPTSCVALAFESGSPHRQLPRNYLTQMFPLIKGMGLTPLVVGETNLGIRLNGVLDMSGQSDMETLVCILSCVGAVVAADSGVMHLAAAVGTPTLGCFSLFSPETRLSHYEAPTASVIPTDTEIAGDTFPAGPFPKADPGAWVASLTPGRIAKALREFIDIEEPEAPELVMPDAE